VRRRTVTVDVGGVKIGGDHPIVVQSMTDTDTADVEATLAQAAALARAGSELVHPTGSPPLGPIRSLAYFVPVIEEVLNLRVHPDYFGYLRHKIERLATTR